MQEKLNLNWSIIECNVNTIRKTGHRFFRITVCGKVIFGNSNEECDMSVSEKIVKIRYVWFPEGPIPPQDFFQGLFASAGYVTKIITDFNAQCDFEVIGVFKPKSFYLTEKIKRLVKTDTIQGSDNSYYYPSLYDPKTSGARYKIWLTTENIRPPAQNDFLITLSFDQFDFDETNFYCPYWFFYIGLFGFMSWENPKTRTTRDLSKVNFTALLTQRRLDDNIDRSFAYAIIGNPHPVRLKAIQSLRKVGPVDIYGRITGIPLKSKLDILKKYKFEICFENDIYPGYVSEKLLDAYINDSIPVYWGDLGQDTTINQKCFINMKSFSSTKDFLDYIASIDESVFKQIYEQPFLKTIPDVSEIRKKLIAALENI